MNFSPTPPTSHTMPKTQSVVSRYAPGGTRIPNLLIRSQFQRVVQKVRKALEWHQRRINSTRDSATEVPMKARQSPDFSHGGSRQAFTPSHAYPSALKDRPDLLLAAYILTVRGG